MHNAYISSTLFSFSLSDYSSSLNRRYDRIPLSSYSCCSCCSCYPCCAFTVHTRVPLNHSYLYGLRQSSFIQCAPSRRVFLGGGDRYFYRFPVYDDVGDIYDVSCSIKKRNGSGGSVDRRKKGRIRCKVSEENFERYKLGGVEDADAVISLLSEEVSEEYLGGREISQRLARKVEVEKREGSDSEFYRGKKNRVEEKRRGSFAGESSSRRTKGVSSNLLESDSKCRFESRRIDSREKAYGRTQEIQAIPRSDNRRGRTNSSSSSSYYSVSSPGEYEFDEEFNNKDRLFVEETSSRRTKDLQREEGRYNAPVREEFYWRGNDDGGYREVPQQRYTGAGAGDGWDCRKKSEKKLTEVPSEEAGYWEQSLQNQSRLDRAHKTDYRKLDPSPKQVDEAKSKSILAEDLDKATSKHYRPIGMERIPPSRYITQEVAEKEDIHGNDARMTFQPQMQFDSREEKQDVVQRQRKVGTIAGNDYLSKKPQQVTRTSDILDGGSEGISNVRRQYATRIPEEDRPLGQSSVVGTDSQYQQSGERFTRQIELRRKPERFSEMSEILDKTGRISSGIQSEYTGKNQRESSRLDPVSYQELKNQQFQKEHEHHSQIQSRKGSEEISTAPMIHASDKKRETESQRSSEKRIINQRNVLTSAMKHLGDEREKQNKANEKAVLTHRSTGLSSAHGKPFGESSNSQASTSQTSHARMHQVDNDARKEERSSEATLMPPPSQFVARGSQEVSGKPSESSSGDCFSPSEWRTTASLDESYDRVRQTETYAQPLNSVTHEDALRSAHRQEELSAQLVEEFLEKAAQEVSTYALQKADKVSEKVVHEDEKQRNIGLGQYDSEDLRSKGPESRQSPEGSEAKGPSDEMWHVRDPSVQPLVAEASEGNKETKNSIVKKGGRSLWNIVADIARLRWGPRAETPKSAAISDAKSSSNESTSSEAWFSGRESDKNGDDNLKRDKRSKQQEAASSQQQQLGKSFIHTQGELSDTTRSRSNELGPAMPSSGVTEGGSPSNGISSASAEKNIGQKEYITGSSSAMGVGSSLLISRRSTRRSSGIEETSERGQTDATGSSSMQRLEEPLSQNKNAELKQKNIQRNKQVEKDRFDEWEEAYQRESDQQKIDEMFMREALLEAKKAADYWEVPVGAVLVQDGKIIARGYNLVEELRDSTAHAEMICIREASNILRTWRLAETTLYVTLEPCAMCAGAILQARIGTLVWGAPNKLLGADGSWVRLFPEGEEARNVSIPTDKPPAPVHPFHPKMTIRRGILASECADKMQEFFRFRRRKKEKPTSTNPPPSPSPSRLPVSKHNHPSKFLSKMQNIFHILFCL